MKTPNKNEVRLVLSEHEAVIRKVCEEAWQEWMEVPERARFSRRSRASIYHDFAKRRLIAAMESKPGVYVLSKGQSLKICFGHKVIMRLKKADRRGLGSNILTRAVLQFIDLQQTMPEVAPDLDRVEICYRLNKMETRIESLRVTARHLGNLLWSYEVENAKAAELLPIVFGASEPKAPDVLPRKDLDKTQQGGAS